MNYILSRHLLMGCLAWLSISSQSLLAGHHHKDEPTQELPAAITQPAPSSDPTVLQIRKEKIRRLYNDLVFPSSLAIMLGKQSTDDLFQEEVIQGRVNPVGQFSGASHVAEYFYALAFGNQSRVDRVRLKTLMAEGDKVAVSVDIHFCNAPFTECQPDIPVSENGHSFHQIGFFTFNQLNRIISFDLTINNLGAIADVSDTKEARTKLIADTCTLLTRTHYDFRTDSLVNRGTCEKTFDGPEDFKPGFAAGPDPYENCLRFMHDIPFGSWNEANSNSVVCRQLHGLLTIFSPDDHCPHTSAEGGGKCIDFSYGSYFEHDF